MGLRNRIVDRGKQLVQSPTLMRWVSDDRVMKAAEGVLDARARVKLAWHMLKNGRALPAVDPALDDSLAETIDGARERAANGARHPANGARHGTNGSYAHAVDVANGAASTASTASNGVAHAHQSGGEAARARAARPSNGAASYQMDQGMEDALKERTSLANVGGHGGQEVPHLHVHLFGGKPLGRMIAG